MTHYETLKNQLAEKVSLHLNNQINELEAQFLSLAEDRKTLAEERETLDAKAAALNAEMRKLVNLLSDKDNPS